uniref:Uncharacterized protein n=1 Tax=Opuntia streptacantha TaxID=393608 RepID=A0A7C9A549_OPUST
MLLIATLVGLSMSMTGIQHRDTSDNIGFLSSGRMCLEVILGDVASFAHRKPLSVEALHIREQLRGLKLCTKSELLVLKWQNDLELRDGASRQGSLGQILEAVSGIFCIKNKPTKLN